jgi:glycosyltransferase involved in cell wall biosynthesis
MNILVLADVFYPDTVGGSGRVAYHLGLELSKKGHEVHIVARNIDGKFIENQQLNPSLFVHRFLSPQKESINQLLLEIKHSLSIVKRLYNKTKFDIACAHQSMAAIGPSFSSQFKNTPFVYYYHSPWHEEYLVKKGEASDGTNAINRLAAYFMRRIERRILFKSSKVIVLSRYMRDNVSALHGYPSDNIKIIPGGVDLDHFRLLTRSKIDVKQSVGFPVDKVAFLTVRNLVPRMGLENLIEAFGQSEILREKGVLFIGGTGFLLNGLKESVERFNLQNSISFLGHIPDEDLPEKYQAADFFVLPTEKLEGFGLVILEAMACGTPVIGTPVGAIPELIELFDEKLLFKGTGWKDIKEKLEQIITNPDGYKYGPNECSDFVAGSFSWTKVADEFEEEVMKLVRNDIF